VDGHLGEFGPGSGCGADQIQEFLIAQLFSPVDHFIVHGDMRAGPQRR
jgi:hypothetical protein